MATADHFTWSTRIRSTDRDRAMAYVRRHRFVVGAPVQFDEQYDQVTALEFVLAAFGSDLVNGLRAAAHRRRVRVDDVEASVHGRLNNPLTYLGVVGEHGHPGLEQIAVRVFVSTDEDEARLQSIWEETLDRSPLVRTLSPVVELDLSLKVIR